ncbi:MAG: polymer-forming cytoskeletal protein [Halorientalis sp.]
MPLRSDPLDHLQIPDGTTVEEHDLVTDGDVIVGGQSTVEFGVRGHTVIGGERVRFGGDIEAEGDCRLDMWSDVAGNVLVGENAYLGERVHIAGQLMVSGDLDIGDDVDIEEGFEANGWIVIRNPMPTIVFLFVYLSHLLRIGEEEMADDVLSQLTDGDGHDHDPVLVPRNSRVSDDAWRVSTPATIGDGCRLHGNVRAESLTVGEDNEIFGSLRAREDVDIGAGTEVTGNVTTREGTVHVAAGAHVRGDVSGADVRLHEDAVVEGAIRARGETTLVRDEAADERGAADEASAETADDATVDDDAASDSGTPGHDGGAGGEETAEENSSASKQRQADDETTASDEVRADAATADDDADGDGDHDDQSADAEQDAPEPSDEPTSDAVESDDGSASDGADDDEPDGEADSADGTERVTADDDHRENGDADADAAELAE